MTTDTVSPDVSVMPPAISLLRLFLKFLRFGCLAFGGPVAQIAMIRHALVDEEKWIDSARFNRLLAVMQILPGPEAHELCVHLGMTARGRIGGLLAGLGFMLPGFILMLLIAWGYNTYVLGKDALHGVMLGLQVAVLAVIVRAVQRIGQHALPNMTLLLLALVAMGATLAEVPFWVPLLVTGLVYMAALNVPLASALVAVTSFIAWLVWPGDGVGYGTVHPGMAVPATTLALFIAGLKGGLLTFGGAYTAIPYVRQDTVGRAWLSDATFLDGVALAGILPAPLVIFGTFAGYMAGGLSGALAVTAGIFLPAFAFSMIFYEHLEAVVANATLHRFLDGVAAAVVGTITATLLQLAEATFMQVPNLLVPAGLLVLCLFGAWKLKGRLATPAILAFGGIAGAMLFR